MAGTRWAGGEWREMRLKRQQESHHEVPRDRAGLAGIGGGIVTSTREHTPPLQNPSQGLSSKPPSLPGVGSPQNGYAYVCGGISGGGFCGSCCLRRKEHAAHPSLQVNYESMEHRADFTGTGRAPSLQLLCNLRTEQSGLKDRQQYCQPPDPLFSYPSLP